MLLVDDHPAILAGARALLGAERNMEIVGEAGKAQGALSLCAELEPDIVILDVNLRGEMSGIEVCRELKTYPHSPKVLIHTAYNTSEDLATATLAGADGYLHKGAEYTGLADAVRRTVAGERVWVTGVEPGETEAYLAKIPKLASLTRKEREVYALILGRLSNRDIATSLYLSLPTIKTHVRSILRKMEVRNRWELF